MHAQRTISASMERHAWWMALPILVFVAVALPEPNVKVSY